MAMLKAKEDFRACLRKIITPLKDFYTPGRAGLRIGYTETSYSEDIALMEGFSRVLWGLAPLWGGGGSSELDEVYLEGIKNGTNPSHPEYWGELSQTKHDQRAVEMTAIGLALILAPEKIWYPLSDEEKANLERWLFRINSAENPLLICNNNWQLFPVIVNLGLKSVGARYDEERINKSLKAVHSFYRDHGWYHDGLGDQADYYVAFAIHFYSLIYARVMEWDDPENSRIFKERAEIFAKSFVYWFDEDGSAIPYGRSLTYRFAQVSFFSACLFAGVYPFPIGVMKGIISRGLEWWMSKPIFDNAGILTVGYGYPNLIMSENYNSPGSPYWALKSFLILALDDSHEFWSAEALPLPRMEKLLPIPEACMTVQRVNGYSVALTAGQWAAWRPTHVAEKYSKFAYSSRYAFSVSKLTDSLTAAAPDSTLAFEIDGMIFYRGKCLEARINPDGSVYSLWSPFRGISVETLVIPTDDGHIRRHTVTAEYDTIAYDTAFSTPIGCKSGAILGDGEQITIFPEANTNILYPKTEIKAIKYLIKKGTTKLETRVIYPDGVIGD